MTAQARLDTLEAIIDVMLQEAENGTLEQAAAEIRAACERDVPMCDVTIARRRMIPVEIIGGRLL